MPLKVMAVVLFAALLHASWNFLVKRTEDKYLSMSGVVIGHLPFSLAAILLSPTINPESWPYILGGAALHIGYQLFLLTAYRLGDLSQVYPLARGVAPLLVASVSVMFLGLNLTGLEQIAVIIMGIGIMSLCLVKTVSGQRNGLAALAALITGAFIASYSLVDGLGAREAGTSVGFYGWLSILNAIIYAMIMRIRRPGVVTEAICRNWRFTLVGGGISFLAYALITWSFTMAPIALVAALRETSIIFALLLGVFILRERLGPVKVLATMLTISGVVLLRLNL